MIEKGKLHTTQKHTNLIHTEISLKVISSLKKSLNIFFSFLELLGKSIG